VKSRSLDYANLILFQQDSRSFSLEKRFGQEGQGAEHQKLFIVQSREFASPVPRPDED
jgi:hypothetical protein